MQIKKILVLAGLMLTFIPGKGRAENPMRGEVVPPGKYYVQSAIEYKLQTNKGFWDLKGKNPKISAGMEVKVWELSDRAGDRQYTFKPVSHPNGSSYYEIMISNIGDARLGLSKGQDKNILKGTEKISKGALMVEKAASADNQLFWLSHAGNGEFIINTFDNRFLMVHKKAENGGAIIATRELKNSSDAPAGRWVLINVETNKPYIPPAANAAK